MTRRVVVAGLWLLATGLGAAQQPLASSFTYEVAAIRPNTSSSTNMSIDSDDSTFIATNVELKSLLEEAYDLQLEQQLIGLPGWANGARYDVNAKMDADTAARLKALHGKERDKADRELLQSMLADRLGLKIHHEMREMPVYALVQAKGGSKLKTADPNHPQKGNMSVHNGKMEAYSAEMQQLGYFLSYQAHRPVVDKTGLTGKYDIAFEWTRDELINSAADGSGDKAPGLFTALQEQLGLKLESTKAPVDTIVVDHIEPPTEN